MRRFASIFVALVGIAVAPASQAARAWIEGQDYARLSRMQHTSVAPGKIEVLEVFSYGCPGCNGFQPVIAELQRKLPANAQLNYLPASFKPEEDFPMFQQAYFAAQSLGIAEHTHQAIFDAVWKTGELAISDPVSHRLKNPQPTIQDAARCYGRLTGVKPETFLAAANSFGVALKMKSADSQILAMQVPSTPCIVVNGKYRVILDSLRDSAELIDLVRFLVTKESST